MMKIKKKPVQIVIPGGRIRSLDILCNHLNHEKQYFDECFIWINTDYSDEVDFIKSIGKKYDFVNYSYLASIYILRIIFYLVFCIFHFILYFPFDYILFFYNSNSITAK